MLTRLFAGLGMRTARSAESTGGPPSPRQALRSWIAADTFPAHSLAELCADPLRERAAYLIAAGGDASELERVLRELVGRDPPAPVDLMLLAEALLWRGSFDQAGPVLAQAALLPGRLGARACALLAEQLFHRGEFARAQALIQQAVAAAPDSMSCQVVMGTVLDYGGRMEEARTCFQRAVAARPDSVYARVALAIGHLFCGAIHEGFAEWVVAEQLAGEYRRESASPAWDGRPLGGERVLILTSNYYGDVIQLLRFVRHLREREPLARLCIQIQPELGNLAVQTGLFENVYVGKIADANFDWQVTLPHLILLLDIGTADLTRFEPYVRMPEALLAEAAGWLPPRRARRLRVGLRWSGRPMHFDGKRSVPFGALRPLFAVPGVDWVALTENAGALKDLGEHPLLDLTQHLTDFCSTGAVMSHLDLVITVDTAVAHLAGALKLPTWLLARPDPEWRWGASGAASPWYGSVRIFRHSRGFDWDAVVADVAAALAERAASA